MDRLPDIWSLQTRVAIDSDQEAYEELFHHFYPSLYQLALSYLKSGHLAEEVVSDVFLKVWKKRKGLTRIENLKLYLFTSTRNTSLNYIRKNQKQQLPADQYRVQIRSIYFNPEQVLITTEMINRIQKAILQLPPRCQLIFKLVKEDDLKYREVANLLGLSIKTVENQMAIAIRKIGEAIAFDIRSTLSSGG